MEKDRLNDGVEPHTPGNNDNLAMGSSKNTGGKHGADHKLNAGSTGTNAQNGDVQTDENIDLKKEEVPASPDKSNTANEQSFNGNNDADANRTPYAGVKEK